MGAFTLNKKAEAFQKELKNLNLENLQAEELKDDFHTVIFRSNLDVAGTLIPFAVFIDDSIYTIFRIQIATKIVTTKEKEQILEQILEHINDVNMNYKIFKCFINKDGDLFLDCCIPFASNDAFNPKLIRVIMGVAGQYVIDEYDNMMKAVK